MRFLRLFVLGIYVFGFSITGVRNDKPLNEEAERESYYPLSESLNQALYYFENISPFNHLPQSAYDSYKNLTDGCLLNSKSPLSKACRNIAIRDAYEKKETSTFQHWNEWKIRRYLHTRIDCRYEWQYPTAQNLRLQQRSCQTANYTQGGAAIEVLAVQLNRDRKWPSKTEQRAFYNSCIVTDFHNGTYGVHCPFQGSSDCTAFVPIFDFENYAQFSELFALGPLRLIGGRGKSNRYRHADILVKCSAQSLLLPKQLSLKSRQYLGSGWDVFDDMPMPADNYLALMQLLEPMPSLPTRVPNAAAIEKCLIQPQAPILMEGDSHLRFIFDWLVTHYLPASQHVHKRLADIPYHHGYVKFPAEATAQTGFISFYPTTYLHLTAQRLENACAEAEALAAPDLTLVLGGTGAWDLDTLPLRNALQSGSAQAILKNLRNLLLECQQNVRIVWLGTHPASDWSLFRHSYNVGALNYFFIKELRKLQKEVAEVRSSGGGAPKTRAQSSLHIVDTFSVVFPYYLTSHPACKIHYMCRETYREVTTINSKKEIKEKEYQTIWHNSAAGLEVAYQLVEAICNLRSSV